MPLNWYISFLMIILLMSVFISVYNSILVKKMEGFVNEKCSMFKNKWEW